MSVHRVFTIAARLLRQLGRDRRAIALVIVVPIVVMGLLAVVLNPGDKIPRVALRASGTTDLFLRDIENRIGAIDDEDERVEVVVLADDMTTEQALVAGKVDAVLEFPPKFIEERVSGNRSTMIIRVEGSDPMWTADIGKRLRLALPDSLVGLPKILPADCASHCGDTIPDSPPTTDVIGVYGEQVDDAMDFYAPVLPPFFVFFFVFLLAGLTFQRERVSGTAERLLASPLRRSELVAGYMLGFLPAALIQATITVLFARYALGGPWAGWEGVVAIGLLALCAESAGVFVSAFARTEFEVIQFIPVVILSQLLLCGVFWQISDLPTWLQPASRVMPLTYAVEVVRDCAIRQFGWRQVWPDLLALVGFTVGSVILGALSAKHVKA